MLKEYHKKSLLFTEDISYCCGALMRRMSRYTYLYLFCIINQCYRFNSTFKSFTGSEDSDGFWFLVQPFLYIFFEIEATGHFEHT